MWEHEIDFYDTFHESWRIVLYKCNFTRLNWYEKNRYYGGHNNTTGYVGELQYIMKIGREIYNKKNNE